MTPRARIAIIAIASVALVVAFFGARGSEDQDDPPKAPAPQTQAPAGSPSPPVPTQETAPPATTAEPTATTGSPGAPPILIVNGKPVGGVAKLKFSKGNRVRFVVLGDADDEIHVHGYDIRKQAKGGKPVDFSFKATIEGRFEVELEGKGVTIAQLDVEP